MLSIIVLLLLFGTIGLGYSELWPVLLAGCVVLIIIKLSKIIIKLFKK